MKIMPKQEEFNEVAIKMSNKYLIDLLDTIDNDQIEKISITIRKPEADNGEKD